jgi:ribosomal protein L11 methyltransferase
VTSAATARPAAASPARWSKNGQVQLRWAVPYRVDLENVGEEALERLVALGALDVESLPRDRVAALLPDSVTPDVVAQAVGLPRVAVSPAPGRDEGSVWILSPRRVRIGRLQIVPAGATAAPGDLQLIDAAAFGTGLHPTTALCLEALDAAVLALPDAMLDVGTGSGVLALAALMAGVPQAVGLDIDETALSVAAENARLNRLGDRLDLRRGGPETIGGAWPLVIANVLAAPLIEMAPTLVQRVRHHGRLVLSGIPSSVEGDVDRAYRRLGMRHVHTISRDGWVALVLQASW